MTLKTIARIAFSVFEIRSESWLVTLDLPAPCGDWLETE